MNFQLIDASKASLPIERMCDLLDVSDSGYCAWECCTPSLRQMDDMICLAHIREHFELSNGTYGYPRMHAELVEESLSIGKQRVALLMRANGLKVLQKRRFKRTTDSKHHLPVAANILDQDFVCDRLNQKWAADISYMGTTEGWLYLAIVLDLHSRKIVGWAVSDRLRTDHATIALFKAIAIR